jgi:hypothetical protein
MITGLTILSDTCGNEVLYREITVAACGGTMNHNELNVLTL